MTFDHNLEKGETFGVLLLQVRRFGLAGALPLTIPAPSRLKAGVYRRS